MNKWLIFLPAKKIPWTWSSHPGYKIRCKPLPPIGEKSDHDIVLFDTSHQVYRARPPRRKIFLLKKANIEGIRRHINVASTTFTNSEFDSIDGMWASLKTVVTTALEQNVPTKMSSTRRTHPWVSTSLRRMMRRKQRAHRKAKKSGQSKDWDRFKRLQSEVQRSTRTAHRRYMADVVSNDLKENTKRFWSFIKSKRQESTGVAPLINKEGYLHSDSTKKAEILNHQFQSVYMKEDTDNIPDKGPSPFSSMDNTIINPNGKKKLLKDLRPFKSAGPDGIPTFILRAAAEELSPILSLIYQRSLDDGCVPADWREALIVPLYKKGLKHLPSNYRPVSLTSVACKVLEHIIHSNIMRHFDHFNILTDKQHGFRKRRSTATQLIATIQGITSKLRSGKDQVDVILLDFAKAFDKVPHQRLLYKLSFYGIRGDTLKWIEAFLGHRKQQVLLDGCRSHQADVISGVPEGTVLGPLLFLAFINDLPESVKASDPRLFADDCLLYKLINCDADAESVQQDLLALEEWERKWQMKFHPEKCQVIHISTNKRHERHTVYRLHGHTLEAVDSGKYLGLTISDDFSWHRHVDAVAAKASRTLGFLRRNLGQCTREVKNTAYTSLVRPVLEYASTAWDPTSSEGIVKLEKVQRQAARFVHGNYSERDPGCVTRMVCDLGWETLESRRKKDNTVQNLAWIGRHGHWCRSKIK